MIAIDWNPTHRFLRQFAGLFVLFFAIIGAVRFYKDDPTMADVTVKNLRRVLDMGDEAPPIFGICLGNQLLSLAATSPPSSCSTRRQPSCPA